MKKPEEKDILAVLGHLIAFNDFDYSKKAIDNPYYDFAYMSDVLDVTNDRLRQILIRLIKRGYLTTGLRITEEGRSFYHFCQRGFHFNNRYYYQWKNEVLTGMTKSGKPTTFSRAVLPKKVGCQADRAICYEYITWLHERLAAEFNRPVREIQVLWRKGLIARCPGAPGVDPHLVINTSAHAKYCSRCRRIRSRMGLDKH